jgi:hypothetical protein
LQRFRKQQGRVSKRNGKSFAQLTDHRPGCDGA